MMLANAFLLLHHDDGAVELTPNQIYACLICMFGFFVVVAGVIIYEWLWTRSIRRRIIMQVKARRRVIRIE